MVDTCETTLIHVKDASCLDTLLSNSSSGSGSGSNDGGVAPGDEFEVTDLWTGEKGTVTGESGWTAKQVPGGPGVTMVILKKMD